MWALRRYFRVGATRWSWRRLSSLVALLHGGPVGVQSEKSLRKARAISVAAVHVMRNHIRVDDSTHRRAFVQFSESRACVDISAFCGRWTVEVSCVRRWANLDRGESRNSGHYKLRLPYLVLLVEYMLQQLRRGCHSSNLSQLKSKVEFCNESNKTTEIQGR